MSRTRIVKGKYTKITGGEHRMFSEGNIISSAGKKYFEKGEDGGVVFGDPQTYEPWKSLPRYDWYHCVFGHTTNKKVPITDLGINMEVEMCLTGITSIIRFEAYDLNAIIIFMAIFCFFSIMGIYSLVVDNLLYWMYRKNNMNAFLVSNSICFIYIVFSAINSDLKEYDPIYYFCAPLFFILNILSFFILKQNRTQ